MSLLFIFRTRVGPVFFAALAQECETRTMKSISLLLLALLVAGVVCEPAEEAELENSEVGVCQNLPARTLYCTFANAFTLYMFDKSQSLPVPLHLLAYTLHAYACTHAFEDAQDASSITCLLNFRVEISCNQVNAGV